MLLLINMSNNFGVYCLSKNKKPSCDESNVLGNGQNLNQTLVAGNFTGGERIRFTDVSGATTVAHIQNLASDIGLNIIGIDDSNILGGANMVFRAGDGVGANLQGGTMLIQAGSTTDGTLGGNVDIFSGNSTSAQGGANAGAIRIFGGASNNGSNAGVISIAGGIVTGGAGDAGDVLINGGTAGGTGDAGFVTITSARDSPTAISLNATGVASGGVTVSAASGNGFTLSNGTKFNVDALGGNAIVGQATLVAGSVTVNTTSVTGSSEIIICRRTIGGTPGVLDIGAVAAGVSFDIDSDSNMDTSTVTWFIIN